MIDRVEYGWNRKGLFNKLAPHGILIGFVMSLCVWGCLILVWLINR